MKTGQCPKCDSTTIATGVPLLDMGHGNSYNPLSAILFKKPFARIFREPRTFEIRAWICGDCGYTELYTQSPQSLVNVYQDAVANAAEHKPVKQKRDAY